MAKIEQDLKEHKEKEDLNQQMKKDKIQIVIGPPKKGDPDYIRKHTQYIRAVKAITSRSISNCFFENPLIRMYTLLSEKLPNSLDKIIAGCKEDLEGLGDDDTKKILKLRKKLYISKFFVYLMHFIFHIKIIRQYIFNNFIFLIDINFSQ